MKWIATKNPYVKCKNKTVFGKIRIQFPTNKYIKQTKYFHVWWENQFTSVLLLKTKSKIVQICKSMWIHVIVSPGKDFLFQIKLKAGSLHICFEITPCIIIENFCMCVDILSWNYSNIIKNKKKKHVILQTENWVSNTISFCWICCECCVSVNKFIEAYTYLFELCTSFFCL